MSLIFIYSATLCFLIEEFSPFACEVIIDRYVYCHLVNCCLLSTCFYGSSVPFFFSWFGDFIATFRFLEHYLLCISYTKGSCFVVTMIFTYNNIYMSVLSRQQLEVECIPRPLYFHSHPPIMVLMSYFTYSYFVYPLTSYRSYS